MVDYSENVTPIAPDTDLFPDYLEELFIPYHRLPLSSDFMFAEVMRQPHVCKLFLEALLQKEIARIEYISKQADLGDDPISHGIRLDVYLNDADQTRYDIEMQNIKESNLERRARYYQSGIDRRFLSPGAECEDLPESYVIFICNFDYYQRGLAYYERVGGIKDCPGIIYEDGSHAIFLNAKYQESNASAELIEFLDYVRTNDDAAEPRSELVREARAAVKTVRNNPNLEVSYMTYQQKMRDIAKRSRVHAWEEGHAEGWKEGRKEGREEGREEGAQRLQQRTAALAELMTRDARTKELLAALSNAALLASLFEEYNL